MICDKCSFASCYTCKIPWHEDQTCAQHQFLLNDGETEEYKRKYCKKCPRSGCGAPTKKYKSCHEMECANSKKSLFPQCRRLLSRHNNQSSVELRGAGTVKLF